MSLRLYTSQQAMGQPIKPEIDRQESLGQQMIGDLAESTAIGWVI